MKDSCLRCLTVFGLLSITSAALSQDAIANLLAAKKLSNVPATYQDRVKPGAIMVMKGDGSLEFFDADDTAMPLAVKAMTGPLPTITIEYINSKLNKKGNFAAQFLSWGPGLNLKKDNTLTSDQAVLSVASLPQETIDGLVYRDPKTKTRYESWNPPGKMRQADIYIIEAVYWATELQITSSSSRGINAATGGKLSTCDATANSTTTPPTAKTADGTSTTKPAKSASDQKGGSVKTVAVNAGNAALQSVAKDVASLASATVKTAAQGLEAATVVTLSGGNCTDSNDVAHLTSTKPVPVGMKVDLIGYFKSDPDKFDWDTVPPPLF